ncbi:LIM domain only protein 7 [Clonorchis sinensis]|uniref:LIM domain only protein 7 n=1 Tax=Clonorchis sinensis TaxID=79923 RepID=H2KPH4_CLOSI|nr:LIM domain only protein 7 [Clonorchis sinensis]
MTYLSAEPKRMFEFPRHLILIACCSHPREEKNVQHAEKVAISLFWLARFADQDPNCAHLPRLDYSAFGGVLPRSLIQNSLSGCVGDGITSRFLRKHQQEDSYLPNGTVDRKSPLTIERHTQPHQFVRPPHRSMGNADSAPQQPVDVTEGTCQNQQSQLAQASSSEPSQANNNGLGDDAWQDDLDAWRERRRKASRMQATKMTSLEEAQVAEEKKKQEAIRDRMRQIKSQRSLSTNCYIPTTDIIRPVPPSSPGMALLTGTGGINVFDFSEETSSLDAELVQPNVDQNDEVIQPVAQKLESSIPYPVDQPDSMGPRPVIEPVNSTTVVSDSKPEVEIFDSGTAVPDSQPKVQPGHSAPHLQTQLVNNIISDVISVDSPQPPQGSAAQNREIAVEPALSRVFSPKEYKEVKIRIHPLMKTSEPRWGLTLRAEGPLDTAPFVVERVKIGSAADVCDVTRGDILVRLNDFELNPIPSLPTESINLSSLDRLLDQLSSENGSVNLCVLRKWSQNEDFSDVELDEESSVGRALPPREVLLSDANESRENISGQKPSAISYDPGTVLISFENERLPVFTQPSNKQQTSQARNFGADSPRMIDNPPLDVSLRNPLSTQILNYSEVSVSNLRTSSQADDSSQSVPVINASHPELTNTQPNYVSLIGESIPEKQIERTILISQPMVGRPMVEAVPLRRVQDVYSPTLSDASSRNQQQPDSPTLRVSPLPPPPPPLPLHNSETITDSAANSFYSNVQPRSTSNEFLDFPNGRLRQGAQPRTRSIPFLPSPPSPTFLGEFTESGMRPSGHRVSSLNSIIPIVERPRVSSTAIDRSHLAKREFQREKASTLNSAGDPQLANNGFDQAEIQTRAKTTGQKTGDIALRNIPPPSPMAPLLAENRSTLPSEFSLRPPVYDQDRLLGAASDGQMPHARDLSNRRSYAPPPPPSSKSEAPPAPPRVPLNRGVDPKGKCTACTQELGTGALMIIGSMNLCYHLACFVCSWCGVPLNDGLSNAYVRIRMGQLYCQACYPSRHGHETVPQGDSNRRQTTENRAGPVPLRSSMPISCSDRRMRPRGPSSHIGRTQQGTKPPTYL